jgi:hypothetical protein
MGGGRPRGGASLIADCRRANTLDAVCSTRRVRAATNGVVIATEKKVPSILVEDDTLEKIVHYTGNIGARREEGDGR